jgi:hypothetical protein
MHRFPRSDAEWCPGPREARPIARLSRRSPGPCGRSSSDRSRTTRSRSAPRAPVARPSSTRLQASRCCPSRAATPTRQARVGSYRSSPHSVRRHRSMGRAGSPQSLRQHQTAGRSTRRLQLAHPVTLDQAALAVPNRAQNGVAQQQSPSGRSHRESGRCCVLVVGHSHRASSPTSEPVPGSPLVVGLCQPLRPPGRLGYVPRTMAVVSARGVTRRFSL